MASSCAAKRLDTVAYEIVHLVQDVQSSEARFVDPFVVKLVR